MKTGDGFKSFEVRGIDLLIMKRALRKQGYISVPDNSQPICQ